MTQNSDYIIIDFGKTLKKITDNKKTIIICFLISMSIGVILNFTLPKKYTSEAKILIKNTGTTNLSDINPYIISEEPESKNFRSLFSAKNSLNEEMEIIKSPLVIDNIIKENNLKYEKGIAKGKYISTDDFLKSNFGISKLKNANIIYISYKSQNPLLSYNVVNSVINNYQKIEENLNTDKASKDTEFLEQACSQAENELNSKIDRLKNIQPPTKEGLSSSGLSLLGLYDKRFKQKFKQISDSEADLKKLEIEIAQKTEELNTLKGKLRWSSMIKDMSKKTSNMIILQHPEIKEKYEFSEPQPVIIFIMSIFGWILLSFAAINFKICNI